MHAALVAMQEVRGLSDAADVRACADHLMRQPRYRNNTYVRLHAEVPFVARLGLVYLRIPRLRPVLGRRRRRDDRGVHDRALVQQQTLFCQMPLDRFEDRPGQVMLPSALGSTSYARLPRPSRLARTRCRTDTARRLVPAETQAHQLPAVRRF